MHYTKIVTIVTLLAASAFAAPAANAEAHDRPKKPHRPQPSPGPVQTNNCGSDAQGYCCYTDQFGSYTTCSSMGKCRSLKSTGFVE